MGNEALRKQDVAWRGVRFLDENAYSFEREGVWYKAVKPGAAAHMASLLKQGVLTDLAERGLLAPVRVSALTVEGFPLVLEQQSDVFNVGADAWSPSMFRDAFLVFLRIQRRLLRHRLCLRDGHTANIIMQGHASLRWCDVGSIMPFHPGLFMSAVQEAVKYMLYPLLLRRNPSCGRLMRYYGKTGMTPEEARDLLKGVVVFSDQDMAADTVLDQLEALALGMEIPWRKTVWSGYHDGVADKGDIGKTDLSHPASRSVREPLIARLLKTLQPRTVIDLGANAGRFSRLAAQAGAEVLACDTDEWAVNKHYTRLREDGEALFVKPCVGDWSRPDRGVLTMALALTHHLYFSQNWKLKPIAHKLANTTSSVLLTEFMTNGMGGSAPMPNPLPEDYCVERFVGHLEHYFERVEIIDYPMPTDVSQRILLLCTARREFSLPYANGPLPDDMD